MLNYKLEENNLHIYESYKIKTALEMEDVLFSIALENKLHSNIFKRGLKSLVREWEAHNLLYRIGLFKSHTFEVDLEYPPKFSCLYYILSIIYKVLLVLGIL